MQTPTIIEPAFRQTLAEQYLIVTDPATLTGYVAYADGRDPSVKFTGREGFGAALSMLTDPPNREANQ